MYYTYVLKSEHFDYYYKGHCQELEQRLKEHNSGMTLSIRQYIPFRIVYFERFTSLEEAIQREKYFKTAAGRRFLKSKISA